MGRLNPAGQARRAARGKLIRELDRAGRDIMEIAAIVRISEETVCQHLGRKRGRWRRFNPPIRCKWCNVLIDCLPPEGQPCIACRTRWAMDLDDEGRATIIRAAKRS